MLHYDMLDYYFAGSSYWLSYIIFIYRCGLRHISITALCLPACFRYSLCFSFALSASLIGKSIFFQEACRVISYIVSWQNAKICFEGYSYIRSPGSLMAMPRGFSAFWCRWPHAYFLAGADTRYGWIFLFLFHDGYFSIEDSTVLSMMLSPERFLMPSYASPCSFRYALFCFMPKHVANIYFYMFSAFILAMLSLRCYEILKVWG